MAIDISSIFSIIKNNCIGFLGKTLKSTFWTAILIVIVTLTIIFFLYPNEKNKKFSKIIKPIIYTLISTIIILFIHDSCIKDIYKNDKEICNDLVPLLRREILYLKSIGCKEVQIDEPLFARQPKKALDWLCLT